VNRRATVDFVANQWVKDKPDDFKHLICIHELQKLQDGLSFICDASDGLFPFKTYSEGENPNKREISVKTKQLIEN
jgi:hypothetical protein